MLEAAVAQRFQLQASEAGVMHWRNNVGACVDNTGRLVRYGLGNESAAINARYKSSDYVGIIPMLIKPEHVGRVVGVFAGFETKASDWRLTPGDDRGQAQQRWHGLVRLYGGVAGFVTGPDDFVRLINETR